MRLILFLLLSSSFLFGQDTTKIEISGGKFTQIIFPSDIRTKDPGHKHFVLIEPIDQFVNPRILKLYYAGEKKDYTFESNLQVETLDGYIYDLIIVNVNKPKKTTYIIDENQAITNMKNSFRNSIGNQNEQAKRTYSHYSNGKDSVSQKSSNNEVYINNREQYIRNICQNINNTKPKYSRFKSAATSQNIELVLKALYSDENELYFVFNLKNHGSQPFDIKKWNIYKSSVELANKLRTGNSSGKEIVQPLPYEPEYIYNLSKRIEGKSELSFTIVLSKFTISRNKSVFFDIDELNGERDIYLPIFYKKINYPINYKK